MDEVFYRNIFLNKWIDEEAVKRILEFEFYPELEKTNIPGTRFRGFEFGKNCIGFPFMKSDEGVFIGFPIVKKRSVGKKWAAELIAEDMEVFARILNLFTERFTNYDFDLDPADYEQKRKWIDDILAKIKKLSPKNEMQHWRDTLGNLLREWDYVEKMAV